MSEIVKSIEMVSNGYIITLPKESEEHIDQKLVFEFDEEKEECEAIVSMFYHILEIIRPNSKHNKFNVEIEVKENEL